VVEIALEHSYAKSLEGFYVDCAPTPAPDPKLLIFNEPLAEELGLDGADLSQHLSQNGAKIFSGNALPPNSRPIALAYAGHQFGGFSPKLGDGRALLWGEVIDRSGQRRDLAFKGSGRTPFSRGGDGFAALGPVLREYIMGEGMHALGLPTSRVLACVSTGTQVRRETHLDGAILTRVAASHLRVGTFQYFAARGEDYRVRQVADYTISRHFPAAAKEQNPYLALFDAVAAAQVNLIAQWMGVGFIHGVMNTDNMALSGETIDYGPCAFLEKYNPATVFSSIDQNGRYAYANQPAILGWNLARFAETLLGFFDANENTAVEIATQRLESVANAYDKAWNRVLCDKLGVSVSAELGNEFLRLLQEAEVDFTLGFYALRSAQDDPTELQKLFEGASLGLDTWLNDWKSAVNEQSMVLMGASNPLYIPRNHLVEGALTAAQMGDLGPVNALVQAVSQPFNKVLGQEDYAQAAPKDFGPYRTFCGT
jgi:uncharacterized protein YdiU (UPF0061 family)